MQSALAKCTCKVHMQSALATDLIYDNFRFSDEDNGHFIVGIYLRSEIIKMALLYCRIQLLSPDVSQ